MPHSHAPLGGLSGSAALASFGSDGAGRADYGADGLMRHSHASLGGLSGSAALASFGASFGGLWADGLMRHSHASLGGLCGSAALALLGGLCGSAALALFGGDGFVLASLGRPSSLGGSLLASCLIGSAALACGAAFGRPCGSVLASLGGSALVRVALLGNLSGSLSSLSGPATLALFGVDGPVLASFGRLGDSALVHVASLGSFHASTALASFGDQGRLALVRSLLTPLGGLRGSVFMCSLVLVFPSPGGRPRQSR